MRKAIGNTCSEDWNLELAGGGLKEYPAVLGELCAIGVVCVCWYWSTQWCGSHHTVFSFLDVKWGHLGMPLSGMCALLLWQKPHFSASDPLRVGEQSEASHIETDSGRVPWGLSYSRSVGLIFWLLYHSGNSLVPLHILSKSLCSCWSPHCSIRGLSLWFLQVVSLYVCLELFFSSVPIVLHLRFPGAVFLACQEW